jgi:hypothetical protein
VPNFPGPTFISCPTSIPEARVVPKFVYKSPETVQKMGGSKKHQNTLNNIIIKMVPYVKKSKLLESVQPHDPFQRNLTATFKTLHLINTKRNESEKVIINWS